MKFLPDRRSILSFQLILDPTCVYEKILLVYKKKLMYIWENTEKNHDK